jgi:hypothetical protein
VEASRRADADLLSHEQAEQYCKDEAPMKVRQLTTLALVSLVVVTLGARIRAQAGSQATGCSDADWPALQSSDPAYPEAMELARTLADGGFMISCIVPSKMIGMFDGQTGAALYRTDQGGFEALFLPKPQNFDRLQIVERQESGRYLYSFAGHPTPWPANLINGPRRVIFLKHANRLIVAHDSELADRIGTTLAGRQTRH